MRISRMNSSTTVMIIFLGFQYLSIYLAKYFWSILYFSNLILERFFCESNPDETSQSVSVQYSET